MTMMKSPPTSRHVQRLWKAVQLVFFVCAILSLAKGEVQEQSCAAKDRTCATEDKPRGLEREAEEYGIQQVYPSQGEEGEAVKRVLTEMETYMTEDFTTDPKLANIECRNKHQSCVYWSSLGECEANPKYMKLECAPACRSCEMLSYEGRCPFEKDLPGIWDEPGSVDRFFERLLADPYVSQFEPIVHSRPDAENHSPSQNYANGAPLEGPWVVTLSNVLSEEECDQLIRLGRERGYERSTGLGGLKADGTYSNDKTEIRTSSNTWCIEDCYKDAISQQVVERLHNITLIPEVNSEYLQLLDYEEGQFYKTHHDFLEHHRERPMGVRILTLFLYLNTVEEGGGTEFPYLGITVEPKRGMALLWPNVLDKDPYGKDFRTDHQALPVIKGQKFGANAWYHQRDFKTPYADNCSD